MKLSQKWQHFPLQGEPVLKELWPVPLRDEYPFLRPLLGLYDSPVCYWQ
jgi:hypothetical protein